MKTVWILLAAVLLLLCIGRSRWKLGQLLYGSSGIYAAVECFGELVEQGSDLSAAAAVFSAAKQ